MSNEDPFENFEAPSTKLGSLDIVASRDNDDGSADFIIEADTATQRLMLNEGFLFLIIKGIYGVSTTDVMNLLDRSFDRADDESLNRDCTGGEP